MTVHAVLARPRAAGPLSFEGVYLHNAGGPAEMGPVLWNLMRDRYRFDPAGFWREMIDGNLEGWSSIDCLGGPLAQTWDGRTKLTVEQRQRSLAHERPDPAPTSFQGDPRRAMRGIVAPPITESSDAWGAVFAYVVGRDGLRVLFATHQGWRELGLAPWGAQPDWDAIERPARGPDEEQVMAQAYARMQAQDFAGAQAILLAHVQAGFPSPPVLANLFYAFARHDGVNPVARAAVADLAVGLVDRDPAYLFPLLLPSLLIELSNQGRGRDAVRICASAAARGVALDPTAYNAMAFGALSTRDPDVMRDAVAQIERALVADPGGLGAFADLFDNLGSMHVALGNRDRALQCVARARALGYEHFAEMLDMPDYAPLRGDPEFQKLFR